MQRGPDVVSKRSRIVNRRGRTLLIEVLFKNDLGKMLLFATLMLMEQPVDAATAKR